MIAHVGGLPLEELLPALSGAGGGLLVIRGWIMLRVRQSSSRARLPRATSVPRASRRWLQNARK